jgi:ubiquinone/menaquinone biosynthesis C-methylase UbiE
LCLDHVKDLKKAIKEMSRVLKNGGYLYYSYKSPVSCLREYYEDKDYEITGIGKFIDKRNNKVIYLGASGITQNLSWISDNKLKVYNYPFQIHLKEMIKNNLELLDVVDCYPIKSYKNIDLEKYKQFSKYPLWVIYVCRKK